MIELTRHKNLGIHQNVNSDVDISVDNSLDKSDLKNSDEDSVDKKDLVNTKDTLTFLIKGDACLLIFGFFSTLDTLIRASPFINF